MTGLLLNAPVKPSSEQPRQNFRKDLGRPASALRLHPPAGAQPVSHIHPPVNHSRLIQRQRG